MIVVAKRREVFVFGSIFNKNLFFVSKIHLHQLVINAQLQWPKQEKTEHNLLVFPLFFISALKPKLYISSVICLMNILWKSTWNCQGKCTAGLKFKYCCFPIEIISFMNTLSFSNGIFELLFPDNKAKMLETYKFPKVIVGIHTRNHFKPKFRLHSSQCSQRGMYCHKNINIYI